MHTIFGKWEKWGTLRGREWRWVVSNLDLKRGKILDVGCSSNTYSETISDLDKYLLKMGYEIYGLDVGKCKFKHPNFRFIRKHIQELDYPENYFDAVTCVSTIEHIGLPFYVPLHGTKVELNGDLKAMEQMKRVLKKGGCTLITGPYGVSKVTEHFRIYDHSRLERLVEGFKVIKGEFFVKKEILRGKDKLINLPIPKIRSIISRLDGIESFVITSLFRQERCKPLSQSEAERVFSPYFPRAVFCLKLLKT
jgi:SAM-dependent methyltransferase